MQKECKRAIFTFDESDEALIDELAAYLDDDSNIQPIYDFFEVEQPTEKIEIEIVPTKKEYDEKYKELSGCTPDFIVQGWMIGCYLSRINKVFKLSINDYKSTPHVFKPEDYDKVLLDFKKGVVHEYVHYVTQLYAKKHNCGWRARYLSEGLAVMLSNQEKYMTPKFDYALEDITAGNVSYSAYYALTKYLVDNYDKRFVLGLLESNREANEFLENELYDKVNTFYNQQNT